MTRCGPKTKQSKSHWKKVWTSHWIAEKTWVLWTVDLIGLKAEIGKAKMTSKDYQGAAVSAGGLNGEQDNGL